jgi:thiol-disulfide isomerase/thioredoxin
MIKFYISYIFLVVFAVSSFAQNKIKLMLKSYPNTQIGLFIYDGFVKNEADSGKTDSIGYVELNYPDDYHGMGLLRLNKNEEIIVILDERELTITSDYLQNYDSIKYSGIENNLLDTLMMIHQRSEKILAGLYWLKPLYNDEDAESANLISNEIKRIVNRDSDCLAQLPDSMYLKYYMQLRWYIEYIPATLYGSWDRLPALLKEIYNYDFSDKRLYQSGLLGSLLENYAIMCESAGSGSVNLDSVYILLNAATDHILETAKKDAEISNVIAEYLFKLYEKRSLYRSSEHLSLELLENKSCTLDDKLKRKLEQYREMKNGNAAPDIVFDNPVYGKSKLSEIKSEYKFIAFQASWCSFCQSEMPKLLLMKDRLDSLDIAVVSISLDTNKNDYLLANRFYPWFNYCDFKGWNSKAVTDYYVYATPTFYLLDKNNDILFKISDTNQLEALIDQVLKSETTEVLK